MLKPFNVVGMITLTSANLAIIAILTPKHDKIKLITIPTLTFTNRRKIQLQFIIYYSVITRAKRLEYRNQHRDFT